MILRVYLIKTNGESVYRRSFEGVAAPTDLTIPAHVRACSTLFHSSSGTSRDKVYTLDQNGNQWSYLFFETFAVVLLTTGHEEPIATKQLMLSLGKAIASEYGEFIASWSGNIGDIEEMDSLVEHYLRMDLTPPTEKELTTIDRLVSKALENQDIAYIGIIDPDGKMLSGNIPANHLGAIQLEVANGVIRPTAEMVPTTVDVHGQNVQLLKVNTLTVAVAPYKDGSRISATTVVSELVDAISKIVCN